MEHHKVIEKLESQWEEIHNDEYSSRNRRMSEFEKGNVKFRVFLDTGKEKYYKKNMKRFNDKCPFDNPRVINEASLKGEGLYFLLPRRSGEAHRGDRGLQHSRRQLRRQAPDGTDLQRFAARAHRTHLRSLQQGLIQSPASRPQIPRR